MKKVLVMSEDKCIKLCERWQFSTVADDFYAAMTPIDIPDGMHARRVHCGSGTPPQSLAGWSGPHIRTAILQVERPEGQAQAREAGAETGTGVCAEATVKLLTKVHIKHTARLHPDWTEAQLLDDVRVWADPSGPYADTVTIEDVREVLASMSDPRQEAMW